METVGEYLVRVQERLCISDSKDLAERLFLSVEMVEGILRNEVIPEDKICLRIAYLVGDDPVFILAIAHYSSGNVFTKPYWEKILLKLKDGRVFHQGYKDRRSRMDRRVSDRVDPYQKKSIPPQENRKISDRRECFERRTQLFE